MKLFSDGEVVLLTVIYRVSQKPENDRPFRVISNGSSICLNGRALDAEGAVGGVGGENQRLLQCSLTKTVESTNNVVLIFINQEKLIVRNR